MPVTGVSEFERFFRAAAGLDIDETDIKRYGEFINRKIRDLVIRGQAVAQANNRLAVEPFDLPITKGLQERIHEFRKIDEGVGLKPILERIVARPPLDMAYGLETEAQLPEIAGGMSVALARTFPIIDPKLVNPATEHWERAYRVFDLLM
jgi:hypothetical protein